MPLTNLNRKLNPISHMPQKRNYRIFFLRLLIVLIGLFIVIYLPCRGVYQTLKDINQNSQILLTGIKTENLDLIGQGTTNTKQAVESLNTSLNFLFWLRVIPYLNGFYTDALHFVAALNYELDALEEIITQLEPYKNELGLTGQATAGQDRIAQVVKILDKIIPGLDNIEPSLKKASEEVENIDTDKYPQQIGSIIVKNRVKQAKDFIMGANIAVTKGKDALVVAPTVLGEPTPQTYLLLFQNDKELRPTGGFITAYAFLKLDKGHLSTTASDDIYRLDEKLLKVCLNKICPLTPPEPIVKYLPEVSGKARTAWSMRDSNISPDFPTAAKEFERIYQLLGEGKPFNGIIAIDTQVVEELIKITGPVEIFGTTYSANTDSRCNCPNVIYELEHYAQIASQGEADRKAVVGALMQQILARALGINPQQMPDLITTIFKLTADKHIMFYMDDPKIQQAFSKLDWTGEIKTTAGDYLHVNDANFAGGKSNLYVDEKVTLEITVDEAQPVRHKLTIEYKNPRPFNIWLNGILRDYVRIYLPEGSQLISSKGSDDPVTTKVDQQLKKTYFEAFITVRPQNSRVLSFEYTTAYQPQNKKYDLLIQKQPGAKDHHYLIKLNNNTKADFNLVTDQQFSWSY